MRRNPAPFTFITAVLTLLFLWLTPVTARAQIPGPTSEKVAQRDAAKAEFEKANNLYQEARKVLQDEVNRTAAILAEDPENPGKIADASTAVANLSNDAPLKKLELETGEKKRLLEEKEKALADAEKAEEERLKTENGAIYEGTLALLAMFLVLAIVLENALEVLFKWRVFQARFSTRGIKAPIMLVAAGFMVFTFNLDILANLVALYKARGFNVPPEVRSNFFTGLISAFTLAGGSAGVNSLMVKLGLRKENQPVIIARPPADRAWVAIKVTRVDAAGDLHVHLDKVAATSTDQTTTNLPAAPASGVTVVPAPLVGTIRADQQPIREIMFRNANRFPQNGGLVVDTVSIYKIIVTGKKKDGTELTKALGPFRFAPGAIADFTVTL